jgi:hypothetical protein
MPDMRGIEVEREMEKPFHPSGGPEACPWAPA